MAFFDRWRVRLSPSIVNTIVMCRVVRLGTTSSDTPSSRFTTKILKYYTHRPQLATHNTYEDISPPKPTILFRETDKPVLKLKLNIRRAGILPTFITHDKRIPSNVNRRWVPVWFNGLFGWEISTVEQQYTCVYAS